MIGLQMPFQNLALLLPSQIMQHLAKVLAQLSV
jgi:hypothetical protein